MDKDDLEKAFTDMVTRMFIESFTIFEMDFDFSFTQSKPTKNHKKDKSPKKILGLQGMFSKNELKAAYRAKIKKHHPDQFTDPKKKAKQEKKLVKINLAYETLLKRFG